MNLDQRYFVVKVEDAIKYLSEDDEGIFLSLLLKIALGRNMDGRNMIDAIVIESDWPEYEPTLELLSARVDKGGE